MRKAVAWLSVPVVLAWSALAVAAPPRSLTAAESTLPADVEVLASANLKTLRTSKLYAKAFGEALAAERDLREGLGKIKKSCGIDPEKVLDDVTVGVDRTEEGGIFVALSGVTEKQFLDCITKVAKEEAGEQLVAKKTGVVTELSTARSQKKLYFAWLPGDVLAFASEPDDKALLDRVLGGKGEVKRTKAWQRLKGHDLESVLLAGWTKRIPGSGLDLKSGSLGLAYKAGKVSAETVLETGSKDDAEQIAAATKVLGSMLGLPKDAPKQLEALLKSIEAKTNGAEVKVSASAAEGDLLAILDWALRSQGLGSSKPAGRGGAPSRAPGAR